MTLSSVEIPSAATRLMSSLPGPRPLPLIGNLAQVDADSLHLQLEQWAREFGPLYRVHLGPSEAMVVARSDLIAKLIKDRPEGWRRLKSMQHVIDEIGGTGLFSAEGADWRRQRKLVMGAFDPAHLKRYFPSLVRVTEHLRKCLDEAARSGEAMDLQALLMRYSVDVTAGLAFGIEMNTLEHPDDALQGHLDQVFPMMMKRIFAPFPWWRYFRLPSDRAFDRHLAQIHETAYGFIAAARERLARDPVLQSHPTNLLEAMIVARDEAGAGMTDKELLGNVLTVLLAGEDTTANTLCWALYLLHTHRAEWDALVTQVDLALAGEDLPRNFDTARGFQKIEDCVNETMRLRPVAPLALMEANQDTSVDGVLLRRGAKVILLTRPGAVDTGLVSDAAQYRPQRWRPPADEANHALIKGSMPFGGGPRLCPGRYLAMLEMKMVLAMIARNYRLIEVATADGTPPREHMAFTMFPVGLKIKVAPRQ